MNSLTINVFEPVSAMAAHALTTSSGPSSSHDIVLVPPPGNLIPALLVVIPPDGIVSIKIMFVVGLVKIAERLYGFLGKTSLPVVVIVNCGIAWFYSKIIPIATVLAVGVSTSKRCSTSICPPGLISMSTPLMCFVPLSGYAPCDALVPIWPVKDTGPM